MEKNFLKIHQNGLVLYIVSYTMEELLEVTEIDHYNSKTSEGYQRPPILGHYRKIAKYLSEDSMPVLPTAILTAIHPSLIVEKYGMKLEIMDKLRVVDGQHRIEGIRHMEKLGLSHYEVVRRYECPVIIMAIDDNLKELEINTFININSKGKKVRTDLAIELREKINRIKTLEIQNIHSLSSEECEDIATQIAHRLNQNEKCIWFDSIRLGDDVKATKPISITAFTKSIKEIVSVISALNHEFKNVSELIDNVISLLIEVWNEVKIRWSECFENPFEEQDDIFNIKKGIGAYSIHLIVKECAINNSGNIDKTLNSFKNILKVSQAVYTDWMIGGKFTGMSSGQAIKRISGYLMNKENL